MPTFISSWFEDAQPFEFASHNRQASNFFFFAHRRVCVCVCAHTVCFFLSLSSHRSLLCMLYAVCAIAFFYSKSWRPTIFTERIHQSETPLPALCVCNMVAHRPRRHLTHITTRILTPHAHCMMCTQYAPNAIQHISSANRHIILWGLAYS